ncbi:MAG: methylated-DNA--[protein]-cysteine S-methyltransferase [Peptococcaceae bacterium]|nr:methylated-DNA--[protein]-cysteine S-methyltransferase [Peptococcaceae bacterium]
MERIVIPTSQGYLGIAWTRSGLAVLNLPIDDQKKAAIKLEEVIEKLKIKTVYQVFQIISPDSLEAELRDYFKGKNRSLKFPVDWGYYSDFQRRVLLRVGEIPWGQCVSYGQIARDIDMPSSSRGVGGAVGSNRVHLITPCHRVVSGNGGLGGFGSGPEWKTHLLALEGHDIGRSFLSI